MDALAVQIALKIFEIFFIILVKSRLIYILIYSLVLIIWFPYFEEEHPFRAYSIFALIVLSIIISWIITWKKRLFPQSTNDTNITINNNNNTYKINNITGDFANNSVMNKGDNNQINN